MDLNNSPKSYTAYFSMEIGLEDNLKTYAGGLGILAGDILKGAADLNYPMIGITLLYKNGYFKQVLSETGEQIEQEDKWDYEKLLTNTGKKIKIQLKNEVLNLEIWEYEIRGATGSKVKVYFLNADLQENSQDSRYISYNLYTPFENTRLKQEIALGLGGVKALQELGYKDISTYHLNESHVAFSILELKMLHMNREEIQKKVVFTTHTPGAHGHTVRSQTDIEHLLPNEYLDLLKEDFEDNSLKMTPFCMKYSHCTNAVSKIHQSVTSELFKTNVENVTNGIHTGTWAGGETAMLFDQFIPKWREDSSRLTEAFKLDSNLLWNTHTQNKIEMIEFIKNLGLGELHPEIFTIGFGRRVDGYKRSGFLFYELDRLKIIAEKFNGLQIIFSGKAYFNYKDGEDHIAYVLKLAKEFKGKLKIIYIPDYSINISQMMVQGCDIWLNNPVKPLEASGTSGMKAALNGVPNFSTLDGWWAEGWEEGVTGWSIGDNINDEKKELEELYSKLENIIIPLYINNREEWIQVMKNAIAKNGSHFNTHRVLKEYIEKSYKINLQSQSTNYE